MDTMPGCSQINRMDTEQTGHRNNTESMFVVCRSVRMLYVQEVPGGSEDNRSWFISFSVLFCRFRVPFRIRVTRNRLLTGGFGGAEVGGRHPSHPTCWCRCSLFKYLLIVFLYIFLFLFSEVGLHLGIASKRVRPSVDNFNNVCWEWLAHFFWLDFELGSSAILAQQKL